MTFGRIRIIDVDSEKKRVLEVIGRRCNPNDEESLEKEIKKGFGRSLALEMTIERITGKQTIELLDR